MQDRTLGNVLAGELRSGRGNFRLQGGREVLIPPLDRTNRVRLDKEQPTGGRH